VHAKVPGATVLLYSAVSSHSGPLVQNHCLRQAGPSLLHSALKGCRRQGLEAPPFPVIDSSPTPAFLCFRAAAAKAWELFRLCVTIFPLPRRRAPLTQYFETMCNAQGLESDIKNLVLATWTALDHAVQVRCSLPRPSHKCCSHHLPQVHCAHHIPPTCVASRCLTILPSLLTLSVCTAPFPPAWFQVGPRRGGAVGGRGGRHDAAARPSSCPCTWPTSPREHPLRRLHHCGRGPEGTLTQYSEKVHSTFRGYGPTLGFVPCDLCLVTPLVVTCDL